jgi:tetratricopeptide (TPR) repeat protein
LIRGYVMVDALHVLDHTFRFENEPEAWGDTMGFFKFLSGKGPEEIEAKGDGFFDVGEYGAAKLEYEKALDKLTDKSTGKPGDIKRIKEKLVRSKEALAHAHRETALSFIETEYWDEAEERLHLALELTQDTRLRGEIEKMLEEIQEQVSEAARQEFSDVYLEEDETQISKINPEEEEHFVALCSTLSDEERRAYYSYGEAFQKGFVALNQGDFESAGSELSRALQENPEDGGYILLELASAYLNLGRQDEARDLLNDFIEEHPDSLKAYAILCEILWERKDFDRALEILDACPREGVDPVAHLLLWGETLFQAERYQEAENLFRGVLQTRGWEENVARSLARVYEAAGSPERARDLYLEIMSNCQSCRRAVDPMIKRRFADIGYEMGDHTVGILELYLSLIQEDPDNRKDYYRKISRIYASMGNENEAGRFRAFAETDPVEK